MSLLNSVFIVFFYGLILLIPYIYFKVHASRGSTRVFTLIAFGIPLSLYAIGILKCNTSSNLECLLPAGLPGMSLNQLLKLTGFPQVDKTKPGPTPKGCKVLQFDENFPAPEEWEAAMPNIASAKTNGRTVTRPDYRFTAKSVSDVEKAVQFAAKYNVRLTIITTGHDYLARNDAPSGLSLDCSQLLGVRVLPHFEPSKHGVQSVIPNNPAKAVTSFGNQPAVTFGVGNSGSMVNDAIKESKIFVVSGANPGPALAGGWGQMGGHSPVSAQYGLGVDQFLEFKVVTADGQLKVANKVSNPDLFWALRGGGGGNFGVVVEATVKAHRHVPIAVYAWWINSTTAGVGGMLGLGHGNDGLSDAMAYMASQIPDMSSKGMSGYFYPFSSAYRGVSITVGENATEAYQRSLWDPVLDRMKSFKGMKQWQSKAFIFPNYQDFFTSTYMNPNASAQTILGASGRVLGGTGDLLGKIGALVGGWSSEVQEGFGKPFAIGKTPFDSHMLAKEHLEALPSKPMAVKRKLSFFGIMAVSGNKAHQPDEDVSVNPSWRRAYVHMITFYFKPFTSADILREIAPDMGAYGNEAYHGASNWKWRFWGANYGRLSQIKTKYDPDMVFWNTPGINADFMEVRGGRVCRVEGNGTTSPDTGPAPQSDNTMKADLIANMGSIFGGGESFGGFPSAR